jgi:hypothetical protein
VNYHVPKDIVVLLLNIYIKVALNWH